MSDRKAWFLTKLLSKVILLLIAVGLFCGILAIVVKYSSISTYTTGSRDTLDGDPTYTPSSKLTASWPVFRGGQSLLGVASGKLSDSLKLYWKFRTDGSIKSSAIIEGGRVYIGSDDGKVYGIDLVSGTEIWFFQTEDTVEAAPCFLNGSIFVGSSDSFLYVLNAETGALKWKYETDAKILGSANWASSPEGDKVWILVGSYDSKLHSVDPATGQAIWAYETDNYINGTPAVADGKAVFGGCDEIIHVVSVVNGKEVIGIETGSYIAGSPALAGKIAYTGNYGAELLAVDITTGATLWSYESDGAEFFSSPAVGENQVVIGARDGRLHCVRRDDGKLLWTFETRGNVDSSPVICDGKVVVGSDDGRLYVVRLSDGKELWSYEIGEALTGSPAVAGGMVVIGSEDGYVYAFGP